MRLSLPGPTPIQGRFYMQDRIPQDVLEAARGKSVHLSFGGKVRTVKLGEHAKVALGTADPVTAKRLYCEARACLERALQAFRGRGPQMLTDMQVEALAGDYYRDLLDRHGANPGAGADETDLLSDMAEDAMDEGLGAGKRRAVLEGLHGEAVNRWLAKRGVTVPDEDRPRVLGAFNRAALDAFREIGKRSRGDYRPDPVAGKFPGWDDASNAAPVAAPGDTLRDALDAWQADNGRDGAERGQRPLKSRLRAEGSVEDFIRSAGHGDVRRITKEQVLTWVASMRERGLAAKSIRDGHVATLRGILNAPAGQSLLAGRANPFGGLRVRVAVQRRTRDKSFTDDEAVTILRAALAVPEGTTQKAKAERWLALVQAHTGARAGEIAQLRRQDVSQDSGGSWWITITPEAGSVKTGEFRHVPLHPQLVDWGFPRWVLAQREGHLFFTPGGVSLDNDMRRRDRAYQHAAAMVRALGITGVQPTHGWRHRWKSVARAVGMPRDWQDAIQGHTDGTASAGYGDFDRKVMADWVAKMPWYDLI